MDAPDDDISHLDFEPSTFVCDRCDDTVPHGHSIPLVDDLLDGPAAAAPEIPTTATRAPTVPHENEQVVDGVYIVTFLLPAELKLNPNLESMLHDEALVHAHIAGHMPIGPSNIEIEQGPDLVPQIDEGRRLTAEKMFSGLTGRSREEAIMGFLGGTGPQKRLIATVSMQLGLTL